MITKQDFLDNNIIVKRNLKFAHLGMSNTLLANSLSFLDDDKYLAEINNNSNITGCICSKQASNFLNKRYIITSDDPRFDFFTLLNFIGKKNYKKTLTIIDKSATIHSSAFVSEFNVKIGKNSIIHPNVTILADVEIGDNCIIQSGTVIGGEGFEYKRTSKGIISVFHDGKIIIGNKVEVGSNTSIDKGFSFRNTVIEDDVKIDNLIHIAHGVHIKQGSFIIAGTILGGSTTIEENAWLGINSSTAPGIHIKANGFVSMGAVVTKNVEENQQVTGNFAISHRQFLRALKKSVSDD